jgi:hypothetical protein
VLVGKPAEAGEHPFGHEVERVLRRGRDPLALQPLVEVEDVDPARASLVRRPGDLTGQCLLPDVARHADDLAGLDIRAEADDEVGEAPRLVGEVAHHPRAP